MTVLRAVGVRAPYSAIPQAVRRWVDEALGSRVVEVSEQVGGMSPGCATRVTCVDGTRAFVKAVGTELNPDTPWMFRREGLVLTLLGPDPLWADLVASYDADGWVALLLEDVEGTHPDLTDDTTMARLLTATDELTRQTRARLPVPPAPDPGRGGLNDLAAVFDRWAASFDHLATLPDSLVPRWVVDERASLQAGVAALAGHPMDRLVHWDIRNDNLLVRPTGEVVFVDWGAAGVGPDWLDPLLARLERVHLPWFDSSLATSPALTEVGDDTVTSWLVGIGVFLAWRAHTAVDVNLPTLGDFRRVESARFLDAAARRLDLGG